MSLDDTPTKPTFSSSTTGPSPVVAQPTSLRKRLASKSMHDIKAAANLIGIPTSASRANGLAKMESMSNLRSHESPSAGRVVNIVLEKEREIRNEALLMPHFGRRSETSVAGNARRSALGNSNERARITPSPSSTNIASPFRPLAPPRTSTAPPLLQHPTMTASSTIMAGLSSKLAATAPGVYHEDDLPSPFLKKPSQIAALPVDFPASPSPPLPSLSSRPTSASRGAGAAAGRAAPAIPTRATAASASRPSMASRLLASRAQAQAATEKSSAGGADSEGVGARIRRVSSIGMGLGRRSSIISPL